MNAMMDLLIRNGFVVSPECTKKADIAVLDGKITCVGNLGEDIEAKRVIDAEGKYIIPGVIDAHMHVYAPFQGCVDKNDFYEQSVSAAFGGVTMFMDFTNTYKGDSILKKIKVRHEEMKISAIDYGIHGKIVEFNAQVAEELKEIIDYGCPTYKLFTIYKKEGVMCSDETMLQIFELSRENGGMPMVHCESDPIAAMNDQRFTEAGRRSWKDFAEAKPVFCELEAFSRASTYARYAGCPLIIVHTTNKKCLDIARLCHEEGAPVYIETCPHYLTLSQDIYDTADGHMALCSPPLRPAEERDALWRGISDGTISLIGSDDCTYTYSEKSKYLERTKEGELIQDYTVVPGGISGMEVRLNLMCDGVSKGKITINQLCAVTSANVAKVYGCYPQKGVIAPGSDADFVMLDMDQELVISQKNLHNNVDFCVYEGMKVKGGPVMTVSHGNVIVENGRFTGEKGAGNFIRRRLDPSCTGKFNLGDGK